MNYLAAQKSPYLLQHANNPVDWYPWGEEAFAKAKEEDKPVFLSIGYSTCHWCHVMAHESFEDDQVAQLLNNNFISIKIDREERPDIDAVYMAVCQALTGSGGWPLTIIMTPEQKPFFAGTYLPKRGRYGMTGLVELLEAVQRQWQENRPSLLRAGEEITGFLQQQAREEAPPHQPDAALATKAVELFWQGFDSAFGGFGKAPKFPTAHNLLFLLRYATWAKTEPGKKSASGGKANLTAAALNMAEKTLEQMYRGGLFDHIGGGFSRYSTDKQWLVPHFEKMLYDNALLAMAYTEAYHITKKPLYKEVVKSTLAYVQKELAVDGGGFACGQDADSQGEEGKYYVFTPKEVADVLGQQEGQRFCHRFQITPEGNFEGKSIPNLLSCPDFAQEPPEIVQLKEKLYAYRLARTPLHRDDKVLTSWNSLMIAAMARASWVLDIPEYLQAARSAQRFIQKNLKDSEGRLHVRWREGETAYRGQLEDYAFYALALTELYMAQGKAEDLIELKQVTSQMLALFSDKDNGGFYLYGSDSEQLISRPKETYDGALPSRNSAAALVLARLSKLTGEPFWEEQAYRQLSFVCGAMESYPPGHSVALLALLETVIPSKELVVCTSGEETTAAKELAAMLKDIPPKNLFTVIKTAANKEQMAQIAPFTKEYPIPASGTMYYLCQNGACQAPVQTLEQVKVALSK